MTSPVKKLLRLKRALFATALLFSALTSAHHAEASIVRFTTNVGDVLVRLYGDFAPNSVDNFLNYVTTDRYDGTFIHRVPQPNGFVVQGGGFLLNGSVEFADGIVTDDPIADEPNFSNTRGTLSFAKNSAGATSQWFFNVGNNSFLDSQGFTVIGRVVGDGMDVVDLIDGLDIYNAAGHEDEPGEDFDQVPVQSLVDAVAAGDVTADNAVVVTSVDLLGIVAGDYDFDGTVSMDDLHILELNYGSTTVVDADGNEDAVIDLLDLDLLGLNFGGGIQTALAFALATSSIPEPTSLVMASLLILGCFARHRPSA